MKVPTQVVGNVGTRPQQQAYVQGDGRNGLGALGAGLSGLGEAAAKVGAFFEQRNQQTDRFNTLKGFSEFETSVAQQLTDFKRGYQADGKGFTQAASQLYDKQAEAYAATVPPELQNEFRYRVAEHKKGVMGNALEFQYAAGDAWFKEGIDAELSKSKTILDQNPEALADEQKRMASFIAASGLPQAVKEEYARNANIGLEKVTYQSETRNSASTRYSIGVGTPLNGDFAATADALIKKEEGYVPSSMWDVNHHRVGYSSDTITNPDGSYRSVREGDTTTRADAQRDLDRRVQDANKAGAALAPGVWETLGGNVKAGLASVYYHYGSYPSDIKGAIKSGDPRQIAAAVSELKSNPARRAREAAVILGDSHLEADPRFANIPYEDKVALRNDADRQAKAQYTAEQAYQKDQQNQKQNDLYVGLMAGRYGQADIDTARQNGTLTQYDDINKANNILKSVNETLNLQTNGLAKLQDPGSVWRSDDDTDKKMLNALVGKQGVSRLQSGDKDYVTQGIIPLVSQTGDIPTDVSGTLSAMARSNNNQQAMFAFDALAQLNDANKYAFGQRVPNDIAQDVELWNSLKDITEDQNQLMNQIRGGTTAAERQNAQDLRREGQKILSDTTNGVPNSQTLAQQVLGEFGGFLWSPSGYTAPIAQQAFTKEFSNLFVLKYSQTGNKDTAVDLAQKELARNWGVTQVGKDNLLMKYPPEKVGYKPVYGSYRWIDDQVRTELALPAEHKFQLFSDEQTESEWQASKTKADAPMPSYRVFDIDSNGVAREAVDENGRPRRMYFQAPAEALKAEKDFFDYKDALYKAEEIIANHPRLQAGALASGTQVSSEDEAAYQQALKTRDALQATQPNPPGYIQPQENVDYGSQLGAW